MIIYAKLNGLEEEFKFNEPASLQEILESCPTLKKLFYFRDFYKDFEHYKINHDDRRLRRAISEIDIFRNNEDYDSLIDYFAGLFRKLIHYSMYQKKDFEVICYKNKDALKEKKFFH